MGADEDRRLRAARQPGSFASVRVCPPSGHCGHEFLRQGRDVPGDDSMPLPPNWEVSVAIEQIGALK